MGRSISDALEDKGKDLVVGAGIGRDVCWVGCIRDDRSQRVVLSAGMIMALCSSMQPLYIFINIRHATGLLQLIYIHVCVAF